MKFEIRSRYNDSVLFEIEADSFVKAVESKKANLYGVNLYGADLRGANLRGADLKWTVIASKYICHLSEDKNGKTLIRIGCECLSIADWEEQKDALANKHDWEWWGESGQYIYEFLKAEAERYDKIKGA